MFPSNFFLTLYFVGIAFSKELESRFITLKYQKHTLIGTMAHYIVNNDKYSELLLFFFFLRGRFIDINKLLYRIVDEKKTKENALR